jgi:hypothetical protein
MKRNSQKVLNPGPRCFSDQIGLLCRKDGNSRALISLKFQIPDRMKKSIIVVALLATGLSSVQAQYQVVENGPNHRVWQKSTGNGWTNHTSRITEIGSGLNYLDPSTGQWTPSREEIEVYPQGAIARHGAFQVIFASNLNSSGAIDLQARDGTRLRSSILGLAYDDPSTGRTVMIGWIQDSPGQLVSSNQVLYSDAFKGLKADVRYTYRKGSFEQDVILRQQPPDPAALGLNPKNTEIEVLTEFIDSPQPGISQVAKTNALPDQDISWGAARIGRGKAFDLGEARNSQSKVSVRRQFISAQGRNLLVESVPLRKIQAKLSKLPLQASAATDRPMMASQSLTLPATPPAQAEPAPMQLASVAPPDKGFVLDYNLLNCDPGDWTFAAGQTYYIANGIGFGGDITIEGGTVIKYNTDPENPTIIEFWGSVTCATDPLHPAIFTADWDDSVGEPISNPSPAPGLFWGAFAGYGSRITWHDLIIRNAHYGIDATYFSAYNCQFVNCLYPLLMDLASGGSCSVTNLLIVNADCPFSGEAFSAVGYQVTVNTCTNLTRDWSWGGDSFLTLFNSLVVNQRDSDGEAAVSSDCSVEINDPSGTVFQAAPNGDCYLAATSPYRDAGDPELDASVLALIATRTTYAPQSGYSPDNDGLPDLGYHYPIDNIDSDSDSLPDWWELYWYGNLSHTSSQLDSGGVNTLHSDYRSFTNGVPVNPNVIQFNSIQVTNQFVNTQSPPAQLSVTAYPYYIAIVLDDTNYQADATWQTFTGTNITVNLGTTQGWHEVWIGLRGHADDVSAAVWQWKRLKLDTTPPPLVITGPTNGTVNVAMIQLTGYSPEALSGISCDLTNALGLVTNQQVFVLNQTYATNTCEFTTNTFQAFDVPLTNDVNTITLHATDLAGNTTTLATNFTLDYSSKTNPVVQITWPQDGYQITSESFTCRGFVDDPTVTLIAQMVDTNSDTNEVSGEVERTGRFWVDNLPLSGGTNFMTLSFTDVLGHTSVTNIILLRGTLVFDIDPVTPDSKLWQAYVNLTGHISDPGYAVWVNGVKGHNNGDGTWNATNVQVSEGGVANFDAAAYGPTEQQPNGTYGNP